MERKDGGVSDGNFKRGRFVYTDPFNAAAFCRHAAACGRHEERERREAGEEHRGEAEGAFSEPRGRRQGGAEEEHRGEAEEARRDLGESKNGNPALGLSPPYFPLWGFENTLLLAPRSQSLPKWTPGATVDLV